MASVSGIHNDPAKLTPVPGQRGRPGSPPDPSSVLPSGKAGMPDGTAPPGGAVAGGSSAASGGGPAILPPDVVMLNRAKAGDRAAYGQLVRLYEDRLYNAVLRLVGDRDEAQELTQEAFTRGFANLDTFRADAAPYTWLFRIAMNLAISQLRKVQRVRTFSLDRTGGRGGNTDDQAAGLVERLSADARREGAVSPDELLEQQERDQQVLAALGRLDADYRAVLILRDVEGFDYQQMADILSLPLGTLKSRLFRARLALRDELKTYMA